MPCRVSTRGASRTFSPLHRATYGTRPSGPRTRCLPPSVRCTDVRARAAGEIKCMHRKLRSAAAGNGQRKDNRGYPRPMATEERVGARLARLRKVRGLTQVQFAAAVHYSVSLIKQVERGVVAPSAPFVA